MTKSPLKPATSGRAGANLGLGCAIPFGLLFFVVGCGIVWTMTVKPLRLVVESMRWVPVEAVVVASALEKSDSSGDGATYRVAIRYRYEWPPANLGVEAGAPAVLGAEVGRESVRTLESDRFDFAQGHTNVGVADMRALIAAHPPGSRVVCRVNPAEPTMAVIDRAPPLQVWLGLVFLLFPLAGACVIAAAWAARRTAIGEAPRPRAGASRMLRSVPMDTNGAQALGEIELKSSESRLGAVFGLAFAALFWNGIVSVFVVIACKEFGQSFMGWFLPIFLIPFVLVGLAMLAALGHAIARCFTPAVRLWLLDGEPKLGTVHGFRWRLGSARLAPRSLRVRLLVREEAVFRRGTDTVTDKVELVRETLLRCDDVLALREGGGIFELSPALVPAFAALNNRVTWELVFDGKIPRAADLEARFALPVCGLGAKVLAREREGPAVIATHTDGGVTLRAPVSVAPGEELEVVLVAAAGVGPGSLSVRLGWFTEGRGTSDADILWTETVTDLSPGSERRFKVRVPEMPWSFSGTLVSVAWRWEVLDRKGRVLIAASLVVAPQGEVVRLPPPLAEEAKAKETWWRALRLKSG